MDPTVYRATWVLPVYAPPLSGAAVRVGPDGRIEKVGLIGEVSAAGAFATVHWPALVEAAAMPDSARQ